MAHPLQAFATPVASSNSVRIPAIPRLSAAGRILTPADCAKFNAEMEAWRQQVERIFNERVAGATLPANSP